MKLFISSPLYHVLLMNRTLTSQSDFLNLVHHIPSSFAHLQLKLKLQIFEIL